MPKQFTLVNWVLRTEERAKEVQEQYQVETSYNIRAALSLPHDLIILCVPSSSLKDQLSFLIQNNETVLCETSFTTLPLETLGSLYEHYKNSQSKIFIAEQYYRYPYFQSCQALTHLLGDITSVRSASLHGHHGTSIIRHFLEEKCNNCTIQASRQTSWIVKTGGRDSIDTEGTRIQTDRTTATLEFEDGKTGYIDFADVQYHSSIRSSHFSLFGERGEITDDTIRYLNEENEGICQNLQRIEDGNTNNNPLSLRAITLGSTYLFRNAYWPVSFNDDEIAVALCMEEAGRNEGYALSEALQDSYLAQCIQRSCDEKKLITTEKQIWADETTHN